MPSKNNRSTASHSSDQQPSLLDQLELDEEQGREDSPRNHRKSSRDSNREDNLQRHNPGHEGEDHHDGHDAALTANPQLGAAGEPDNQAPKPLEKAYARYVEIINETYDSGFSDAKRQAAFKEAAKAHGIRIADLKRYSTAVALGIPYHHNADSEAEPAPLDPETD